MKIAVVFGTRPEAIKLAPLIYKLRNNHQLIVVSTGQHNELLTQVLDFFRIVPDYNFACMSPQLLSLNNCILKNIADIILNEDPDLFIVQGDTLTTYATAFASFLHKKPVFHVEAGLRTYDKFSPFPEEMFRVLITRIAEVHFAPTNIAYNNLISDGISKDRIFITGNTVVDALMSAVNSIDRNAVAIELSKKFALDYVKFINKRLVLITSHRRENIGQSLKNICLAVKLLAKKYNDILFIWSLHKNLDVRKIIIDEFVAGAENIILTEALDYHELIYLMERASLIMTDSGGIQEEAPTFKKPVIILRNTSERSEMVEAGFGFVAGGDSRRIVKQFDAIYNDNTLLDLLKDRQNPYGDGHASEKIVSILNHYAIKKFVSDYPVTSNSVLNISLN
jgi:UDP-N-acetylglucosamine 2-epimerase